MTEEGPNKLLLDTLTTRFQAMMQVQAEQFQEQIDELKASLTNDGSGGEDDGSRPRRRDERPREDRLRSIKIKVPSFVGANDPEAYLEWETKIEQIFNCHDYSDVEKVQVAAIEFKEYALIWWDQMIKEKVRYNEPPIASWEEMKRIMRRRFVPSYYHRDLHNKLQRLTQGSKSVEEYSKEMEVAKIRANVVEDHEATMARFIHGLNRDISDIVELHHYMSLVELCVDWTQIEPVTKKKPSKSKKKRIARRKRLNKLKIKPEASSSSTVKNLHEDSDSEVEYWNKHADCIALQLDMTDDFDNPIEEEEKVPKEGAEFEAYVKNRLELSYARMLERKDYLFSPTSPERLYQWLKGFHPLTEH